MTAKTITFDWDANDNLLSISDGVTTYTNEFDELNRLIEQDGVWGTTLTFGWDAANRRTSVTDNFHGVVSSVYDDVNRLTRRTLSNETGYSGINPIRVDLAYNDRDLTSITRYASLTTSNKVGSSVFTFDDAQRLTALKHKNASDTIFADYGWSFDAGDRITQELLNSVAKNFTYDDTNQLLTATGCQLFLPEETEVMQGELRFFILDTLQFDIEPLSSIVAMLKGAGYRELWPHDFTKEEVSRELYFMIDLGLLKATRFDEDRWKYLDIPKGGSFAADDQAVYFVPTEEGTRMWKEWVNEMEERPRPDREDD